MTLLESVPLTLILFGSIRLYFTLREKGTERERETERETDRQTDREREIKTIDSN